MTKLKVRVRPGRKQLGLEPAGELDKADFLVSLTEPAKDNRANAQLIAYLESLTGAKAAILAGLTDRVKLIEIEGGAEILDKLGRAAGKRA